MIYHTNSLHNFSFFLYSFHQFSFESCKFKVQRNKEGTGRIVVWMLGITNSYTMEASFGGSTLGNRSMTHFSTAVCIRIIFQSKSIEKKDFISFFIEFQDYEQIGRAFCETLLDYSDENPNKVKRRIKIRKKIKKMRKFERLYKRIAKALASK